MSIGENNSAHYPLSTINPETGRSDDIIATARAAVKFLQTLCEQDDAGRYIGRFAINKELENAGFETNLPRFVLFLNQLGLVRKLNKAGGENGKIFRYLLLDPTFFDLIVTRESVEAVLKCLEDRLSLQRKNHFLKRKLETSNPTLDVEVNQLNENLAEVVVEVERLKQENHRLNDEVSDLKKEISEKEKKISFLEKTGTKVADELMMRFRALKEN